MIEDGVSDAAQSEPLLPPGEDASPAARPGAPGSERHLQVCVTVGCAAVYAARTVVPLVVPEVSAELGWNSVLVGYVLSFFFWGYAVTQVPGGRLADRLGAGRVLVVTALVGAGSLLVFPAAVAVWPPAVVLLRLLLGLVQGPHYPALMSLTAQAVAAPRCARFLSTALLGSPLGTIAVGVVGSALLERLGWRAVMGLTGALYAAWAGWLHALTRGRPAPGRAAAAPAAAVPWRRLLASRAVWACVLVHMSHIVTWFLLISWLPTFFKREHPEARGWLVNSVPFACNAAGTLLSVPYAEWLFSLQLSRTAVRKTIELSSQLAAAAALLALPHVGSSLAAAALVSVAAGAAALHVNGGILLPQDLCPDHVGSLFGVMNTGGALAGFVANLAAGFLLERYGHFGPVFTLAAAAGAAGAAQFAVFGSAERLQL